MTKTKEGTQGTAEVTNLKGASVVCILDETIFGNAAVR